MYNDMNQLSNVDIMEEIKKLNDKLSNMEKDLQKIKDALYPNVNEPFLDVISEKLDKLLSQESKKELTVSSNNNDTHYIQEIANSLLKLRSMVESLQPKYIKFTD